MLHFFHSLPIEEQVLLLEIIAKVVEELVQVDGRGILARRAADVHEARNHQNERVRGDASVVRRIQVFFLEQFLQEQDDRLQIRVLVLQLFYVRDALDAEVDLRAERVVGVVGLVRHWGHVFEGYV